MSGEASDGAFRRLSGRHATTTPYLLDVRSDRLDGLDSRRVIPQSSLKRFPKVTLSTRLTPVVPIEGMDFLLETPKMGAVPRRVLRSPVTSLNAVRGEWSRP